MVELFWSMTGIVVAICVAVLAVTLVVWAIIAIGLEVIKNAGRAKCDVAWLRRIYGKEEK